MRIPRRPRLLLFAVAAIAIMGSAVFTAASYPSAPLKTFTPWTSTGSTAKAPSVNAVRRLKGLRGVKGKIGPAGPIGATGASGPLGLQGIQGSVGPPGPVGPSQYAYIYNVGAGTVAIEADVPLDTNGAMTSGITHAVGTPGVTLVASGTYKVTFSVTAVGLSQVALFVNGTLVPGTIYGSGAGTQQNNGQAIFTTTANDVLTIRNHTTAAAIGLQTLAGGSQATVNASLVIEKLG